MGPNSLLKVMAGDKVSATTIYYYQNPVTNTSSNTSALNSILSSLTSAIGNSMGAGAVVHGAASNITSNLSSNIPFNNITSPDAGNDAGTNPKAYLTVIFFDERFNFVAEGSTTQRVQAAGNGQAPLVIDNIKAPKNGYAYIYISNESVEPVYFDNLRVVHERAQIIEENHYYAYGLKIAGLSSVKAGDINEGELKNKRQYQGAFAEYDDDIQWNEFALRDYDPQIARWVQQDPYQQFASPYVALGSDPVNMVDPSGGWSAISNVLQKSLSISRLGVCAITTFWGAIAGAAHTNLSGREGAKGAIVGAFLGLASNFSGSISMAVLQGVVGVGNEVVKNQLAQMPVATPMPAGVSSTNIIGKANQPVFEKLNDVNNIFPTKPEKDVISFIGFNENSEQPDPRLQLTKKASNWDKLFEGDLAGYNYLGEKLYHFGKGVYSLRSHVTAGIINSGSFNKATIFIKGFGFVNKLKFHRVIKKSILIEAEKLGLKFESIVGANPDIFVKAGEIFLQGAKNGPFSGEIIPTFIKASKFFK